MRPVKPAIVLAVLCAALLLPATPPRANGWEHGAIPLSALLRGLEDGASETRRRAAESLGLRGQPEAVAPLLARLATPETDPHVRSALYIALGRLRHPTALAALTNCLSGEAREELRGDCALALGLLADRAGLPPLLTALHNDESILVRSRAVDALGSFAAPETVAALAGLLGAEEKGNGLRLRAIRALGRSGAAQAVAPLLSVLRDARDADETLAAIDGLGALAAPEARAPLTALLEQAPEPAVRARIAVALGAIRAGDALPALVALLGDPEPAIRYFAVEALRELGKPAAAGPLRELALGLSEGLDERGEAVLLADPIAALAELSLLEVALRGLTELDPAAGRPAYLAVAAPRALAPGSAAALRLADGFYRVRRAALYGLGYTDAEEAQALLAGPAALSDGDPRIRAVAVRALGVLGRPETPALLLPMLADAAAEVRWTAAAVLGRLHDRSAVPALIAGLADGTAEMRRQSALALAYLGDAGARPALLERAAEDDNAGVREAATFAASVLSE